LEDADPVHGSESRTADATERREAMPRIRIRKPVSRRTRRPSVLPLDARDPDVVRAKELARKGGGTAGSPQ